MALSTTIATTLLLLLILRSIYRLTLHPLHAVPGPILARLTRIPLLGSALSGTQHLHHIALHARYGPIVRIGPNHIILSSPAHGPAYYTWRKSTWWLCFRPSEDALAFSTELDLKAHNAKKKRVAGAYSLTSLLGNEERMDVRIREFLGKMRGFARSGERVDMGLWMNWLNFDVLMEMVFGAEIGCVREGRDAKGLVEANATFVKMANVVGVFPVLYWIMQMPVMKAFAPKSTDPHGAGLLFGIAERSVRERLLSSSPSTADGEKEQKKDILQHMVAYRSPSTNLSTPPKNLENEAIVALASGADTVGCTLRVAALQISTNPHVQAKLVAEIDQAAAAGRLSKPARFDQLRKLPYLAAVVQELVRIHPPMASPFWRIAPVGGFVLEGHFVPEGTNVGINEWVVSRNKGLYGEDVDVFRPERWIECNAAKKRERERSDLLFGHGDYMCLGRGFAVMELYKVLVELWREFEVEVVNKNKPWTSKATISFVHEGFWCTLKSRGG